MKPHAAAYSQRLLKGQAPTYERLQARLAEDGSPLAAEPIAVHCGWGRLLIGHTFPDPASLAQELLNEQPGERDIARNHRDAGVLREGLHDGQQRVGRQRGRFVGLGVENRRLLGHGL